MEKQKGLAIITGASQGIGAVIAAGLATDGYRVVLIARSKQNLEKVHDEIMRSNKHVQEPIVLPLDITDCTKADTEIKDIHQKYGAVDILVNAAAMFMDGSLSEPVDNFRKIMEINVIAQYGILKTVTEIMKVQKNGYIFNVASRAAKYGFADGGIYGSTKFALLGLAESLYRELAPLGIRVTTLCPGWVNTDMAKKAGTPFKDEEMIQPDDLLNTIRCLLNLSENVCIKDIVFEMKKSPKSTVSIYSNPHFSYNEIAGRFFSYTSSRIDFISDFKANSSEKSINACPTPICKKDGCTTKVRTTKI